MTDRERCSYNKGHKCPTMHSYKHDLYHWWLEYARRGEYNKISDILNAMIRLKDYIQGYDKDCQPNGFPEDLDDSLRLDIVYFMLEKMTEALDKLDK